MGISLILTTHQSPERPLGERSNAPAADRGERALRVGVLTRPREVLSLAIYRDHVSRGLQALGVDLVAFPPHGPIPEGCDLIWDPGLGSRRVPRILRRVRPPLVGTLHGVFTAAIPILGVVRGPRRILHAYATRYFARRDWAWLSRRASVIICVSRCGEEEAIRTLGLPRERARAIYHGIDHRVFRTEGERVQRSRPYFLHVSGNNPKKNAQRLLAAYARLDQATRPDLVLIRPGCAWEGERVPGAQLIDTPQSHAQLAEWYRGAVALVIPSLHETFGLPIAEAMACGCPVVTSRGTACEEIAAGCAILVDPWSVDSIADGLRTVVEDATLRASLAAGGPGRAGVFTWEACARAHQRVFEEVARSSGRGPITRAASREGAGNRGEH